MADRETELEWEKSKRIEAERMKAAKALEEDKEARINSALLPLENSKIKGYSWDKERILRSIEKASGFSLGFVILGVIVNSLSFAMVMAGAPEALTVLFGFISTIGAILLFLAPILAVFSLWFNFYYKKNDKSIFTTSVTSLVIFLVYLVVYYFVIM